jgi:hypothetical protein
MCGTTVEIPILIQLQREAIRLFQHFNTEMISFAHDGWTSPEVVKGRNSDGFLTQWWNLLPEGFPCCEEIQVL